MNPTISVIIPLYNKAALIDRAVESVLVQSKGDFELIVVDDGSTDGSGEIVSKYRDSRIRLTRQANAGPGAARNRGIREACAPLVAFLDADDEWLPQFLAISYDAMKRHPDCAVSATTYFLGKDRTDVTGLFRQGGMREGVSRVSPDMDLGVVKTSLYMLHSDSTLCRREIFGRCGGFYDKTRCTYGEDYYLWIQVLFNYRIFHILEPLFWYHAEASELCPGGRWEHELEPFLTDIGPVQHTCPAELLGLLDLFLARYALSISHECVGRDGCEHVAYLMRTFPMMRQFRWDYMRLRLKILLPWAVKFVRHIRQGAAPDVHSGRRTQ